MEQGALQYLIELSKGVVSVDSLKFLAKNVVIYVEQKYPELKGAAKLDKANSELRLLRENFDDKLLGAWADWDIIDFFEDLLQQALLNWAWAFLVEQGVIEGDAVLAAELVKYPEGLTPPTA